MHGTSKDKGSSSRCFQGWIAFSPLFIFGLVLALSLVFIGLTIHVTPDGLYSSLFDDAMISFRYARNIADGIGPYWNPGDKVEGFTNPLWTYLMSAVYLASGSRERLAPLFVQVICALLLASNCFLFASIAVKMKAQAVARGYTPALANFLYLGASLSPVLFYPNIYWTLMGMEVALLTFLASVLFITLFHPKAFEDGIFSKKGSKSLLIFFVCVIGQLTRPDFVLVPVSLLAAKFLFSEKSSRAQLSSYILSGFSGTLAGAIAVYGWRSYFFDSGVPNTYLLKVKGVDVVTQIVSGIGFVKPMIKEYFLFFLLIFVIAWCSRRLGRILVLASVVYFITVLAYQIRVGGDPWSYWRNFSASLVLMGFSGFAALLLFNSSLKLSLGFTEGYVALKGPAYLSIGALLSLSLLMANLGFIKSDLAAPLARLVKRGQPFGVYQVDANRQNINTAKALSRILPQGSKIGVFWAGTIPYYMNDYYAVDFLGKSDSYIASMKARGGVSWGGMKTVPGHNKYDLKWTLSNYKPDWIQYSRWGNDDLEKDVSFSKSYAFCKETEGYLKAEYMHKCKPS